MHTLIQAYIVCRGSGQRRIWYKGAIILRGLFKSSANTKSYVEVRTLPQRGICGRTRAVMPLGLPQVAVFVWCGVRGNFLTIDNLIRRQKILVSWCSKCERNAETENHPRIHCLATWEVWTSVLSWFRVVWIFGWSFTTSSFLEREQKEENLGNDSSLFDVDCLAR